MSIYSETKHYCLRNLENWDAKLENSKVFWAEINKRNTFRWHDKRVFKFRIRKKSAYTHRFYRRLAND